MKFLSGVGHALRIVTLDDESLQKIDRETYPFWWILFFPAVTGAALSIGMQRPLLMPLSIIGCLLWFFGYCGLISLLAQKLYGISASVKKIMRPLSFCFIIQWTYVIYYLKFLGPFLCFIASTAYFGLSFAVLERTAGLERRQSLVLAGIMLLIFLFAYLITGINVILLSSFWPSQAA